MNFGSPPTERSDQHNHRRMIHLGIEFGGNAAVWMPVAGLGDFSDEGHNMMSLKHSSAMPPNVCPLCQPPKFKIRDSVPFVVTFVRFRLHKSEIKKENLNKTCISVVGLDFEFY